MLAQETAAPCGSRLPSLTTAHPTITPAFNHLRIQTDDARIANPVLDEAYELHGSTNRRTREYRNQKCASSLFVAPDDPERQCIQCLMQAAPRSKPGHENPRKSSS